MEALQRNLTPRLRVARAPYGRARAVAQLFLRLVSAARGAHGAGWRIDHALNARPLALAAAKTVLQMGCQSAFKALNGVV